MRELRGNVGWRSTPTNQGGIDTAQMAVDVQVRLENTVLGSVLQDTWMTTSRRYQIDAMEARRSKADKYGPFDFCVVKFIDTSTSKGRTTRQCAGSACGASFVGHLSRWTSRTSHACAKGLVCVDGSVSKKPQVAPVANCQWGIREWNTGTRADAFETFWNNLTSTQTQTHKRTDWTSYW